MTVMFMLLAPASVQSRWTELEKTLCISNDETTQIVFTEWVREVSCIVVIMQVDTCCQRGTSTALALHHLFCRNSPYLGFSLSYPFTGGKVQKDSQTDTYQIKITNIICLHTFAYPVVNCSFDTDNFLDQYCSIVIQIVIYKLTSQPLAKQGILWQNQWRCLWGRQFLYSK